MTLLLEGMKIKYVPADFLKHALFSCVQVINCNCALSSVLKG